MGIFDVFTGGTAKKAAAEASARADEANKTNQSYLTDALGKGTGYLQQGVSGYEPLSKLGQGALAGYSMYGNALGLNGSDGTAAAQNAFTAGPGYEWQVGQATDAALRKSNALGSLGGNAATALTTLGSNLANQEYQQWLQNLSGYNSQGINALGTAASGQQQGYTSLANLENNIANARVGSNNTATGMQNQAGYAAAQAGMQGGANLLNFGMNLATLGSGLAGRYF